MREANTVKATVFSLPADFGRALRRHGLAEFFKECAYVHRAGYLSWIAAASRPQTRRERIHRAVLRLTAQQAEEIARARSEFAHAQQSAVIAARRSA